jgi:hypothetical protein
VIIIEFLAGLFVMAALFASGTLGGVWRAAAIARRQADRIGVGALRGGMLVERYRLPLIVWALTALAAALVVAALLRDAGLVQAGFFAGAAGGLVALLLIPAGARRITGGR